MERITLYHQGTPVTYHSLEKGSFSIGSHPENDLVLASEGIEVPFVSRIKGRNEERGREILQDAGIIAMTTLAEAAEKAATLSLPVEQSGGGE